jgi:mannose-6-phosphate isomerase-like protein (cupin superfamily)
VNKTTTSAASALALLLSAPVLADSAAALQRFVDDYRGDPMLRDAYFGVQVGEDWWTVDSQRAGAGGAPEVTLAAGEPARPTWFFKIESADLLAQLDRGEVTFGTLAVKAQSSDYAPMDMDVMPGYLADGQAPGSEFYETLTKVGFHFWYRGNPEVVPFARQAVRVAHGADVTALYYEPGLRLIHFSIKQGQHANKGEDDSEDPWRKVYVFTSGAGKAAMGDRTLDVRAGERIFIAPGQRNEVWNESPTPLEGFLIVFGEGA